MLVLLIMPLMLLAYGCYLWTVSRNYLHLPGDLRAAFPIIGHLYLSIQHSFLTAKDQSVFELWVLHAIQYGMFHYKLNVIKAIGAFTILKNGLKNSEGIFCTIFYFKPIVAISDPNIVEKLVSQPTFGHKEPFIYETVPELWRGPFSMARADKEWKMRRKELTNTLSLSSLEKYTRTFVEVSQKMVDRIKEEKEEFNIHRYMGLATIESLLETHFGCAVDQTHMNELYELMCWGEPHVADIAAVYPISLVVLKLTFFFNVRCLMPVNRVVLMLIENTTSDMKKLKFIQDNKDILYSETIIKRNLSMKKSPMEMRPEVVDLLFVASHTVTVITSSVLVYLAILPDIQEKVWLELQEIFGDSDRDPTLEDLRRMEYLERVLKETLRFVTAPVSARRIETDVNIDGTIIPKGTTVAICSQIMRMDERYWENPSKFDPNRHLKPETFKHAFSPFGFGTRNCPGAQYAYNASKVFISTLLRKFKLVSSIKYEDIKLSAHLTMTMENGYNISVMRR